MSLEISLTDLKSPGLDTGNPASITSTPISSNLSAIESLLLVSSLHPGTCSPSLNVVSKYILYLLPFIYKINIYYSKG